MGSNRDRFIDFCKGFLILWVVQIHTVYWSGETYIPKVPRQLSLLIDVSMFFFISGYLTKVSGLGSLLRRSLKQFKNLYLDYFVLGCLLLFPLGLFYFLKEKSTPDLSLAITSMLRVKPVGDLWKYIEVYPGSLWYLAVYFSLLVVTPFVISLFGSRKLRIVILTALLALFVICSNLGWNYPFLFDETIYILFYLLIFLIGAAYKLDQQHFSLHYLKLAFLTNVTICLLIIFFIMDGKLRLQANKFPPSVIYLPYCLLTIHLFAIVQRMWNYPTISRPNHVLEFLEWCGKNSYSIYLMQGIACSIPGYFIPLLLTNGVPGLGVYVISLLFNLNFTLLLAFLWLRAKTILVNYLTTIKTGGTAH
jgi:peptidoglycan/LPS O-acetylase OafA/YrhL